MKNNISFKEQYKKYSLIAILLILGLAIFFEMVPFIGGVLGAMTIYILLRGQMKFFVEKKEDEKRIGSNDPFIRDSTVLSHTIIYSGSYSY